MNDTSTEPKNHTVVGWFSYNSLTGEDLGSHSENVYYKDKQHPDYLPPVALCIETIDEWAAWWHWHVDQLADAARQDYRADCKRLGIPIPENVQPGKSIE
jgi:hypothetical protein